MKKYIPVFGDQSLFDGAPEDAEYAGWFCQEVRWYMILNGKILFSDGGVWSTSDSPYLSSDIAAMRRIIKEPNSWTWEDNRAGVLPEVGCNIEGKITGIHTVLFNNGDYIVTVSDGHYVKKYTADEVFVFFKPIETPDEKAQREEDEFVESTCRQNEPHSTLYSDGVRAAYRKLKGGE